MSIVARPAVLERAPVTAAARTINLRKIYGSGDTALAALDGVMIEFGHGQFTAIMGPSGSGKSMLLHCLAAVEESTAGQVVVGAAELSDKQLTLVGGI